MKTGLKVRRALKRNPELTVGAASAGAYLLARVLERVRPGSAARIANAAQAAQVPPRRKRLARSGRAYWKRILWRTYEEINEDRLLALAAGVVFYALLALFPAITAFVSSYALFAKASTVVEHLSLIQGMMPGGAYKIVEEQVSRIVTNTTGDLSLAFAAGLALALWSANAGVKAIIDALNIVYDANETRSFIRLNAVSLAFTVAAIAVLLLAVGAVVVMPVALSYVGLDSYAKTLAVLLRWPALFGLLLLGLATLYYFGPDLPSARWRWISPGAVVAAVTWLIGSALLSWYLGSFANYDATYGSLGAGIGLMMWLWVSAIVVLIGAELNSVIDADGADAPSRFPKPPPDRIGAL